MLPKLLHVSFDYSEENVGASTVVVADLINQTERFSKIEILSLRRVINPSAEKLLRVTPKLIKYTIFGLPFSLFLSTDMKRVFRNILKNKETLKLDFNSFDLVHGHKLTFEGFLAYKIAKEFNKKLFISLRQTDFYVLKYRKDLLKLCRAILLYSSTVFYIAPYMKNSLKNLFGESFYEDELAKKLVYLPNILNLKKFQADQHVERKNLLTIVWLNKKAIERKNLYRLFQAIKKLKDKNIILDVIGHGDYEGQVIKWVKDLNIERQVNFLGFISNEQISKYLNKTKAFILPSHSETFGVAYAEALLCGTPILYTKNTGFDGIFEDVGVAVDSYSIDSIAKGIIDILDKNEFYRANIIKLDTNHEFEIFAGDSVASIYQERVNLLNLNSMISE